MTGAGLSPGGHSSLSANTTVSSATPTSPLPLLSPRKASLKRASNVGFRCISPQPGCSSPSPAGAGAATTASQTTPPASVKLVAPSPRKMTPSPPSPSSVLTLCLDNKPMSDGDSTQSDRPATCDMKGLITRNGERDETASEINITRDYSNQEKSAGISSVATTISSTKGAYYEHEAAATTNNSTAHINPSGSLFNFPNNAGGRTEAGGLGSADSLATNLSVLCDRDKVNRPIKVNNHLEHGPCVSNTTRLPEGLSDPLLAPSCSSGSAGQTSWQNKDLLTCRQPRIGPIDVKLEADSVHLSQEKAHSEQATVTDSESGRGFSKPQGHHEQTASLFTLQDHAPSGSSSSTPFTGLSTQVQLLSHTRPEPSLPARPTTTTNSTTTTIAATSIAKTNGDVSSSFPTNTPRTQTTLKPPPLSFPPSFQSNVTFEAAESDSKLSHPVTYTAPTTWTPLSSTQSSLTASLQQSTAGGTDGSFSNNTIRARHHRLIDTAQCASIPVIEEAFDFACHYTAGVLQGLPPLFLAAAERNAATIRLLLKYGANPNQQDLEGCTPLHLSASVEFQSWECAVALIEHGAKVHISNRYGTTPAELSADLTKEQIRILTDTLINTILSTRSLCADIQQQRYGSKRYSSKDYTGDHKSHSGSDGWSTLSAKFRKRRSSHYINAEALIRKASTSREKRQREGSVGRADLLSTGSDRERTSSLSSTRSRFFFNFANKHSTSPPPSNFEDSEMDSKATDPERVSTIKTFTLTILRIYLLLLAC